MPKVSFFSSEFVAPGHPDKVMDTVVGAILDEYLKEDPTVRFACDGLVKSNHLYLAGEITSKTAVNHDTVVRKTIDEIGYKPITSPSFNKNNVQVHQVFTKQSADIAMGTNDEVSGAGDNGIMFGFACNEAPDFTGHAHYLVRKIQYDLFHHRPTYLYPDQKCQVTILYVDDVPTSVSDVVCCLSHSADTTIETITEWAKARVDAILEEYKQLTGLDYKDYHLHVNPTGAFVNHGPAADSGEVGRKIVVDQYCGYAPVGGGSLNGKDPSKVDMSAVLMARKVAKEIVKQGYATKCQIQVAYAIGETDPVSINIDTFGTATIPFEEIEAFVNNFSFRPADITQSLKLRDSDRGFLYKDLGANGWIGEPFGDYELPWE